MNATLQTPVYTGAVKAIEYHIESASEPGMRRTVRVNPLTHRPMSCDCPAGRYGRTCRHRQAVEAGTAGKAHITYGPVRTTRPAGVVTVADLYSD